MKAQDDWFDKLYRKKPVKAISLVVAVMTFITSFLIPAETFEKWKSGIAGIFSDKTGFILEPPYVFYLETTSNRPALKIELPVFSIENATNGEADSLRRIIVYKLIDYLKEDTSFKVSSLLPEDYYDLDKILHNYNPGTSYTRAIKVTLDKKNIRPLQPVRGKLSGYLYLTVLESGNMAYSDTLRLDYINFDREKMQMLSLDSLVEPYFRNYVSRMYNHTLTDKGKNIFFNEFFFLPPAFYLTDKDICFQYVREKNREEYQGARTNYLFRVPYDSIVNGALIRKEGKLKFLLKN